MKSKNKIERVYVEHKSDESPDTSWLGKYIDEPSGWRWDRKEGTLEDSDGHILAKNMPCNYGHGDFRYFADFQPDGDPKGWAHVSDRDVFKAWLRCRYQANGGEQGLRGNLFVKFDVQGWEHAHTRDQKTYLLDVLYACLAAYRIYRMEVGEWEFIGIIAKAKVVTANGTQQIIRSGGLWGIESDSDKSYLQEVEAEQLNEVRKELESLELGFGKRSLDYAFQNVERED